MLLPAENFPRHAKLYYNSAETCVLISFVLISAYRLYKHILD